MCVCALSITYIRMYYSSCVHVPDHVCYVIVCVSGLYVIMYTNMNVNVYTCIVCACWVEPLMYAHFPNRFTCFSVGIPLPRFSYL